LLSAKLSAAVPAYTNRVRLGQPMKASEAMLETEAGTVTVCRLRQPANARLPIVLVLPLMETRTISSLYARDLMHE